MVTTGNWGRLLYPILDEVYGLAYKEYPEEFSKVFAVEMETEKGYHEDQPVGGIGVAPAKAQAESVEYVDPYTGTPKRYVFPSYGVGIKLSREIVDDDLSGAVMDLPKELAHAARVTPEIIAFGVLNQAFNATVATGGQVGNDGVELYSLVHPNFGGGTQANMLTTPSDLTMETLEAAVVAIQLFQRDDGTPMAARGVTLLVPPALEFTAKQLLDSPDHPETAARSINPYRGEMKIQVSHYLTDPKQWQIVTDVPKGLRAFWRVKPEFTQDADFDALVAKYKMYFRFGCGWTDWRGIFGAEGS